MGVGGWGADRVSEKVPPPTPLLRCDAHSDLRHLYLCLVSLLDQSEERPARIEEGGDLLLDRVRQPRGREVAGALDGLRNGVRVPTRLHVPEDALRAVVWDLVTLRLLDVVERADLVLPAAAVVALHPALLALALILLLLEVSRGEVLALEGNDGLVPLQIVEARHAHVVPVRAVRVVGRPALDARRRVARCALVAVEGRRLELELASRTE